MGIFDKARVAADKAMTSAQAVAQQGQAKLNEYQQNRASVNELYRALGEAFFDEQRRGGSRESVVSALRGLDNHFAQSAAGAEVPPAAQPDPTPQPPTDVPPPVPPAAPGDTVGDH
jgi:hypothetical protein